MRRWEAIYSSVLLLIAVAASLWMEGAPVAGPIVGVAIALFLGVAASSMEVARKLRYAFAFMIFLIAAAANRGIGATVMLAGIVAMHFLSWTEGLSSPRRFAVKRGDPLPPDGRKEVYSGAFLAAMILAYLLLGGDYVKLHVVWRGVMAFAAVICGFCLWDVGYVTRLQPAKRFRRPPVAKPIQFARIGLIGVALGLLFMFFSRALPAAAESIQGAARAIRAGKAPWDADPFDFDRLGDSPFNPSDFQGPGMGGESWLNPKEVPREGDFYESSTLILSMAVPVVAQRRALLKEPIYVRAFAFDQFVGDQWVSPEDDTGVPRTDLGDGNPDGRTVVSDVSGEESILHTIKVLEPFSDALPALQGVTAFHLDMLVEKPGDWFVDLGRPAVEFSAESVPSIYSKLLVSRLKTGTVEASSHFVPDEPVYARMAELMENVRLLPVEQRIEHVKRLLAERCKFSLSIRNPSEFGALENFLFGYQQGMCIHFATAGTMLLRLADVPARMAFGLSGGDYYQDKQAFAFRSRDAHAWTEVFLEEHGWTVVDFSPAGAGAARRPSEQESAPRDYLLKTGELDPDKLADDADSSAGWTPRLLRWVKHVPWGVLSLFLLGAIVIYALVSSWKQRRDGVGEENVVRSKAKEKDPAYLREFYALCLRNFGVAKQQQETLREFLGQLKRAGAFGGEFDGLADYHYAVSYEDEPTSGERENHWRKTVRAFEQAGR
jgi:transglutaminase-like putative cysteine protease